MATAKATAKKSTAKKSASSTKKSAGKKGGNWIAGAVKNQGGLHRSLGVAAGKKIPKSKVNAAAKKGGKVGKQARLAQTLGKLNKGKRKK